MRPQKIDLNLFLSSCWTGINQSIQWHHSNLTIQTSATEMHASTDAESNKRQSNYFIQMKAEMSHRLMFFRWLVCEEQDSLFARSDTISIQELGTSKEMPQRIIRRLRRASFQTNKNSLAENVGSFVTTRIVCHKHCMSSYLLTLFHFECKAKVFQPFTNPNPYIFHRTTDATLPAMKPLPSDSNVFPNKK